MRTIVAIILAMVVGCSGLPTTPKVQGSFVVGDHVAFERFMSVWDRRSEPQSFWVDKGETGVIIEVELFEHSVRYRIQLDKNSRQFVYAHEDASGPQTITAIIYPDPALRPIEDKR